MRFEDDEDVKPKGSAVNAADLETDDDCAVDFGDEDALSRAGLDRIQPADKDSLVRVAALVDVCKPRMAWMHYIKNGDKKSAYRCLSKRDKKHNIIEMGICCKQLNNDNDQRAQLNFAVLGLKYKNAGPDGKYKKQVEGQPPVKIEWGLGWVKLSQAGFRGVSELVSEDDAGAHSFDFAIGHRESGVGYKYVRVSQKARFRQDPELLKAVLEEAAKFADGQELMKYLGKKISEVDMRALLAGSNPGGGNTAKKQQYADDTDDL